MALNTFLYIISNLFLLQLMSLELLILEQFINIACIIGIATFGVAHGAIDDILNGTHKGKSRITFIAKYVTAITAFGLFWLLLPNIALFIFLSVSAFHFGQTQLIEFNISRKSISYCLYFLWGSFVILTMFYHNKEILSIISYDIMPIPELYYYAIQYSEILLTIFASLLFFLFAFLCIQKKITFNIILKEVYLLILLTFSFSVLPPFVAFSIFFIFIHSVKAINQEFQFCKNHKIVTNSIQFFQLFIPLTLSSFIFIATFVCTLFYFQYTAIIPFALLILLSAVTIPHSFVMDKFYGINK